MYFTIVCDDLVSHMNSWIFSFNRSLSNQEKESKSKMNEFSLHLFNVENEENFLNYYYLLLLLENKIFFQILCLEEKINLIQKQTWIYCFLSIYSKIYHFINSLINSTSISCETLFWAHFDVSEYLLRNQ
jgi:hypothetical protein